MGKRTTNFIIIFAAIFGASNAHSTKSLPARVRFWVAINRAYEHRNIKYIETYRDSSDTYVKLFSRMTVDRLKMNYAEAEKNGNQCIKLPAKNNADKYMHLVCLSSLSALYSDEGYTKKKYKIIEEASTFIRRNKTSLGLVLGDGYVSAVLDRAKRSGVSENINFTEWPDTKYFVKSKWNKIVLRDGFAKVLISGKPVYFMVDTGTSGININYSYARKVGLLKLLHKTEAQGFMRDFSAKVYGAFYIATSVEFGPIRVRNAYINVSKRAGNVIGLNYLMRLKSFVLSRNSITNTAPALSDCVSLNYFSGGMEFGGYAVTANIHTTKGTFDVLIDTGTRTQFGMPKASLFLYSGSKTRILKSVGSSGYQLHYVTQSQHGKVNSHKVLYFGYRIIGSSQAIDDKGLIDLSSNAHEVGRDGVLGYNILYKHRIYFDFKGRRACLSSLRGGA